MQYDTKPTISSVMSFVYNRIPRWRFSMTSQISVGSKRKVERGFSGRRSRCPNLPAHRPIPPVSVLLPTHSRCSNPCIDYFWRLWVRYPINVRQTRHLAGFAANQVEPGGGHLDRSTRGHGAHKPTGSRHYSVNYIFLEHNLRIIRKRRIVVVDIRV